MGEKINSLFEALTLGAAVGLLIFTFVFYAPSVRSEDAPYQLDFSEGDCRGLGQALAEVYVGAGQEVPLAEIREHVGNFHFGPAIQPADKEYVMQMVDRVYAEYPETKTGERVIMECFANAETRSKGPRI